jgi:hypothetical protein
LTLDDKPVKQQRFYSLLYQGHSIETCGRSGSKHIVMACRLCTVLSFTCWHLGSELTDHNLLHGGQWNDSIFCKCTMLITCCPFRLPFFTCFPFFICWVDFVQICTKAQLANSAISACMVTCLSGLNLRNLHHQNIVNCVALMIEMARMSLYW